MTRTVRALPRPRLSRDTGESGTERRPPGRLARQHRRGWIAAGVMLMCLAVLANVYLFQSAAHRAPVVRVARDVPVGQQIGRADVDVVEVAVDSAVQTVPGHQLDEVVGRRSAVDLRKGTLLAASHMATRITPQPGQALVTVPMKASEAPQGLAPGWQVRVVSVPGMQGSGGTAAQGSGATTAPRDIPAVVDQVTGPDAEGTLTASLLVADADSSTVARQAAAGTVTLVVTARRG
ncbi:SAF domain-containing protein [Actinomadura craniellae]|nr:SAF domain-containing protein [Actinomadura craniellae]